MGVGAAKGVTLGREGVDQGGADGLEKPSVEIRHGSARVKISAIEFSARVEVTMAEVYGGPKLEKAVVCGVRSLFSLCVLGQVDTASQVSAGMSVAVKREPTGPKTKDQWRAHAGSWFSGRPWRGRAPPPKLSQHEPKALISHRIFLTKTGGTQKQRI